MHAQTEAADDVNLLTCSVVQFAAVGFDCCSKKGANHRVLTTTSGLPRT